MTEGLCSKCKNCFASPRSLFGVLQPFVVTCFGMCFLVYDVCKLYCSKFMVCSSKTHNEIGLIRLDHSLQSWSLTLTNHTTKMFWQRKRNRYCTGRQRRCIQS